MNTNGIIVHYNQLSQSGKHVLKDGSQVLVRIIADNGNGKYTGSVAGVRVNIKSNHPMIVGKSFIASISQKDGTIYVTPKDNSVAAESMKLTVMNNEQIYAVLKNLGIPLDKISVNLFQQLKQMEQKLDSGVLNKLHNLVVKFKGKEKSASEILAILNEKKIDATEEDILSLITFLQFYDEESNDKFQKGKQLLNHINKKEGSWFILPFEMVEVDSNCKIGNGNLRLLFDKNQLLKIMNLDCFVNSKRYLFNIFFQQNRIKKIRFNTGEIETSVFVNYIKKKFPYIEMELAEIYELEGSGCESEEFLSYTGVI